MKIFKYTFPIFLFALIITSCTDNFEEINENTNASETIQPEFLLTNVITELIQQNTYDQGFDQSNYFAHFSAAIGFGFLDRYIISSNGTYWNNLYSYLQDIKTMQESEASNEAYHAVGDILKAFISSQLTDMWNNVPYSQATSLSEGVVTPAYDEQESIYTDPEIGILALLRKAASTLENSNQVIQGDVMFNNDLDKWMRFANSLQLRYLLRISKRLTDYTELQALASTGKLMVSNADNAVLPYLAAAPNQWPFFLAAAGANIEHVMTFTVDSVLTLLDDPRIGIYYKPTQRSLGTDSVEYRGVRNGQNEDTIGKDPTLSGEQLSLFGGIFRDVPDGIDAQFMQYAEVQFALAEAAQRGYITGSAQQYYESGITATFEYYGLEVPVDYFAREAVALNGTDNITKIMTQKWLSLINVGHEAWFNIRRTGIPKIVAGPDAANDGRYPVRYLYPESEQATNASNYQEAVNRIGGDNINSKGWWEKD
jgi:hypothetical protein